MPSNSLDFSWEKKKKTASNTSLALPYFSTLDWDGSQTLYWLHLQFPSDDTHFTHKYLPYYLFSQINLSPLGDRVHMHNVHHGHKFLA